MIRSAVCLTVFLLAVGSRRVDAEQTQVDLLVVGGTESGWAAAIQAARMGVESIAVVHDGRWLGGQYTEQALACVDENKGVGKVGWGVDWHPMKRSFHRSGLFKELMDDIEAHNTAKYGSPMPGKPYHGPSTFRPVEAERSFRRLIQPYVDSGQIELYWNYYPVAADTTAGDAGKKPRLRALRFRSLAGAPDLHVRAGLTIDASDWGEAIQVAGAAFECGPDPRCRYGEALAPEDLSAFPPNEMNPITWAMIVVQSDGETPIPRPEHYDVRNYVRVSRLSLEALGGLNWDRPVRLGSIRAWPPGGKVDASPRQLSVYNVRRVVDGYTSKQGRTIILLNYMNGQDYPLERLPQRVVDALEADEPGASQKNIVTMTRRQRQIVFDDAKQHALGVLYHLQNFVHRRSEDTTHSFRHFHLSDEFGTPDKLPPKPYIRESLRLKAMYMMRLQDGRNTNGPTKKDAREQYARIVYHDGVLAWQFHYDFHRTGRTYLKDVGRTGPWIDYHKPGRDTSVVSDRATLPLRSLIPVEMDGLLGAQKNVGYSSLVSAAIRLHDQCVHIGQAAGAAAAVALNEKIEPREIPFNRTRLERVRDALCGGTDGALPMLLWPFRDLATGDACYVAVNRLAARGAIPLRRNEVDFRPDEPAADAWRTEVVNRSLATKRAPANLKPKAGKLTRGEFAQRWWQQIQDLPDRPFSRDSADDADSDGIPDVADPLPLDQDPESWPALVIPPEEDGHPAKLGDASIRLVQFNFTGQSRATPSGEENDGKHLDFQLDNGLPFSEERGYGWGRDVRRNHRRRGRLSGLHRDTFLFTRDADTWEYEVQPGRVEVTVCIGDSGFDQPGQNVTVEGQPLFRDHDTTLGRFAERIVEVDVTDGRLTIEIGKPGATTNTCLNWIRIVEVAEEQQ